MKEYKELLDTGGITQEEYDAKKRVPLNQPEQNYPVEYEAQGYHDN
ncbi:SHOCT domain-containing protein [Weissella muntiaci]|nr:SHOCT domain-containing protein [Weissella muntiaci]